MPGESKTPIFVTRPKLPDFDLFVDELRQIWKSGQLSNYGPVYASFKADLGAFLGIDQFELVNNGTIGLYQILASRLLEGEPGEIITTPFTFPATAQCIRLAGQSCVFADVDPHSFNLDPKHVESLITDRTRAIVPVHVYGWPCDVDAFEALGQKYGIPVVYDAAHAFGVRHGGRPLLAYGDASMVSFHATKILHTIEGGLIWSRDPHWAEGQKPWGNFGLDERGIAGGLGFNSKLNEISCLMGKLLLPGIETDIAHRRRIFEIYQSAFAGLTELSLHVPSSRLEWNYQYAPILVAEGDATALQAHLLHMGIHARRYFWPLCSEIPGFDLSGADTPVAAEVSQRVLCLPIASAMPIEDAHRVAGAVRDFAVNRR